MTWPIRESSVVYENPWIVVREDRVVRPDGSPGIYGVVELRSPAVFIVALDHDDRALFVQVDRHTVGSSWEIPAGATDGEEPLRAAQRELREETGMVAASWTRLGQTTALNGICRAPETIFLARSLTHESDATQEQRLEGIGAQRWIPLAEAFSLSLTGEVTDSETIAALALAAAHLGLIGAGPT